jgi:hypothetical protein
MKIKSIILKVLLVFVVFSTTNRINCNLLVILKSLPSFIKTGRYVLGACLYLSFEDDIKNKFPRWEIFIKCLKYIRSMASRDNPCPKETYINDKEDED